MKRVDRDKRYSLFFFFRKSFNALTPGWRNASDHLWKKDVLLNGEWMLKFWLKSYTISNLAYKNVLFVTTKVYALIWFKENQYLWKHFYICTLEVIMLIRKLTFKTIKLIVMWFMLRLQYIHLFDHQIAGIFESIFDESWAKLGLELRVHFKGCP